MLIKELPKQLKKNNISSRNEVFPVIKYLTPVLCQLSDRNEDYLKN